MMTGISRFIANRIARSAREDTEVRSHGEQNQSPPLRPSVPPPLGMRSVPPKRKEPRASSARGSLNSSAVSCRPYQASASSSAVSALDAATSRGELSTSSTRVTGASSPLRKPILMSRVYPP